jgi:hypothetical protein
LYQQLAKTKRFVPCGVPSIFVEMKNLIISLFVLMPIFSFGQSSIIKNIDSIISSYERIKGADFILLTNNNDKKLDKNFGNSYKFKKSDKKLLLINVFLKKEPSYSLYKYYYLNDSLIKVIIHSPEDTFREYYYNHSKFIYTNDVYANDESTTKNSAVLLKTGAILKDRGYKYLHKKTIE